MLRIRGGSPWGRLTIAAIVTVAGFGLASGLSRAAALGLPTLPPVPTPTLGLPTLCPTPTLGLPTPVPTPLFCPSLTPLPTLPLPTLPLPTLPLPVTTPPLSTPSSGTGPPTGLPTLPGSAGPGLPLGGPPTGLQPPGSAFVPGGSGGTGVGTALTPEQVQASVLGSLLGFIGTPANVGVEQPSLEHFGVGTSGSSGNAGALASGARGGAPPPAVWALVGVLLVAFLAVGLARQHRRRLSRLRTVAAVPLIILVGGMTVAWAQGTWSPAAPAASPATIAVTKTASHSTLVTNPATPVGSILFNRVLAYETQISQAQAGLQSPSSTGGGVALVRAERDLALSLEATMQQEYNFFATVARDQSQSSALIQASAGQSQTVRNAVTYDVQAVQAQLAQQAAITQAAARNNTAFQPVPSVPAGQPAGTPALMWPMSGVITQGFGPSQIAIEPALSLAGISYRHFHTGIDIAAPFGTPVMAAGNGVVALAGSETDGFGHLVGYGNYVVIAHGGGMITLYGHLDRILVQPGQQVQAGVPIGLEGSTGNSTGPHVHFELRVDGIPTDPRAYVTPA